MEGSDISSVREYRALIEHSADLITLVDSDGTKLYESPSVERILGFTPDDLVGPNAFALVHPDDRPHLHERFLSIIDAPGVTTESEAYRCRHADGSWVWLESTMTNQTNTPLGGYVINSRDISARKQYAAALEEASTKLEILNRVLRHDIRNDMAVILGWGHLLEDHVDAEGRDYLQKLLTSGDHVVELTETARDYVRTVVDGEEIETRPVSLRPVLEREVDLARDSFPHAAFVLPSPIPAVEVMANVLLSSALRNVLTNAVKHNDSDDPLVEITVEPEDETVLVRIADNGPGISDERTESIFGKGERGLDSTGTGIGLYLVQEIVANCDGAVWVDDAAAGGAAFNIRLRRAP